MTPNNNVETKVSREIKTLARQKVLLEEDVQAFRKVTYEELARLDGNTENGVNLEELPQDIQESLGRIKNTLAQIDGGMNSRNRDRAVYRALTKVCRVGAQKGRGINHRQTAGRRNLDAPGAKRFDQQKFDWLISTLGISFSPGNKFDGNDINAPMDPIAGPDFSKATASTDAKPSGTPDALPETETAANTNEAEPNVESVRLTDADVLQYIEHGKTVLQNGLGANEKFTDVEVAAIVAGFEAVMLSKKEEIKKSGQMPAIADICAIVIEDADFDPQKKKDLLEILKKDELIAQNNDIKTELEMQKPIEELGMSLATIMMYVDNPQEVLADLEPPIEGESEAEAIARQKENGILVKQKLKQVITTALIEWTQKNKAYMDTITEEQRNKDRSERQTAQGLKTANSTQEWIGKIHEKFKTASAFVPITNDPILSMAFRGQEADMENKFLAIYQKKNPTPADFDNAFAPSHYAAQIEKSVNILIGNGAKVDKMMVTYRKLEVDLDAVGGDVDRYKEDLKKVIKKMETVSAAYKDTPWEGKYQTYAQEHGKTAMNFTLWLDQKSGIGPWEKLKYTFKGLWKQWEALTSDESEESLMGERLGELKDKYKNADDLKAAAEAAEAAEKSGTKEAAAAVLAATTMPEATPESAPERTAAIKALTDLKTDPVFVANVGAKLQKVKLTNRTDGKPLTWESLKTWDLEDLKFVSTTLSKNKGDVLASTNEGKYNARGEAIGYHVLTAPMPAYAAAKIMAQQKRVSITQADGVKYLNWHTETGDQAIDEKVPRVALTGEAITNLNDKTADKMREKLGIASRNAPLPDTEGNDADVADSVEKAKTEQKNSAEKSQKIDHSGYNQENLEFVEKVVDGETVKVLELKDGKTADDLSKNDMRDITKLTGLPTEPGEVDLHNRSQNLSLSSVGTKALYATGTGAATFALANAPLGIGTFLGPKLGILVPSLSTALPWVAAVATAYEAYDYFLGSSPLKVDFGKDKQWMGMSFKQTFKEMLDRATRGEELQADEKEFITLLTDPNVQTFLKQFKKPGVAEQIGDTYLQSGRLSLSMLKKVKDYGQPLIIEKNRPDENGGYVQTNPNMTRWSWENITSWDVRGDLKVKKKDGTWADFNTFDELEKFLV